jgi:hypothetical protein
MRLGAVKSQQETGRVLVRNPVPTTPGRLLADFSWLPPLGERQ